MLFRSDLQRLTKPVNTFCFLVWRSCLFSFAKSNPMEKEQDIDKARFWLVDCLAGVGEGTVKHVYAYAIKLKICERWARLTEEAGDSAVLNVINANDPAYASTAEQE